MRILPGDPLGAFYSMESMERFTDAQKDKLMADLGLDRPLYVQYASWMGDLLTGSLGKSFLRGDNVADMILLRGPISAQIGVLSIVISWIIGLPVGILSAVKPNTIWDKIASFFTVLFLAIPGFWLAMLVVVAQIKFWQYKSPIVSVQIWENPIGNMEIIIMPAIVLGIGMAAQVARMARSSLFEVLREDFVRTARSKGLSERLTMVRHALPNALLPVITLSGVLLGFVLGGSVAIEQAFTTPGLGKALVTAAIDRDLNVVQNLTFIYGLVFIAVTLAVDLMYGYLDPRLRVQ
tara:strand:- start:1224 stop:2102 length:879 start_codon:yes stop_codon:yes gene_type:complete